MARKAKKTRRTTTKRASAKRKTTKGKSSTRKSTKKSGEMLLVGSKVKAEIKRRGCNTAGDAFDGLNHWMHWLVEQATQRAKANGRKTVRAYDFMS